MAGDEDGDVVLDGGGPGEDGFEDVFANAFDGFAAFALEEGNEAVAAEGFVADVVGFDDAVGVEEEDVAGLEVLVALFDVVEFADASDPWSAVGEGFDGVGGSAVDEGVFVASGEG